jgi:hypothetical protein
VIRSRALHAEAVALRQHACGSLAWVAQTGSSDIIRVELRVVSQEVYCHEDSVAVQRAPVHA